MRGALVEGVYADALPGGDACACVCALSCGTRSGSNVPCTGARKANGRGR